MSSSTATEAYLPRTRTPPDLKWLLNERAALAGQRSRQRSTLAKADIAVEMAWRALDQALDKRLRQVEAISETNRMMDALDRTMALISAELEPSAGGVVLAWSGRWGERGALTDFLLSALSDAGSVGLPLPHLLTRTEAHFDIQVKDSYARKQLRDVVSARLRNISRQRGLIERVPGCRQSKRPPLWRCMQNASLDELRSQLQLIQGASDGGRAHSDAL